MRRPNENDPIHGLWVKKHAPIIFQFIFLPKFVRIVGFSGSFEIASLNSTSASSKRPAFPRMFAMLKWIVASPEINFKAVRATFSASLDWPEETHIVMYKSFHFPHDFLAIPSKIWLTHVVEQTNPIDPCPSMRWLLGDRFLPRFQSFLVFLRF